MPQENLNQDSDSASEDSETFPESIDLDELADRIVALMLREISIETERTGR